MCESGVDWALFGAVLFGLVMFGVAYNALIHVLGNRKAGYVSLLVTGGVLITLAGATLICWQAALIVLGCFVASGLPMIVGEIYRAISEREKALSHQRQAAQELAGRINHDDPA